MPNSSIERTRSGRQLQTVISFSALRRPPALSAHVKRYASESSILPRSTLSISEALVISVICFGLFILSSLQASMAGFPEARFSNAGNLWTISIELILGTCGLLYLRARTFDIARLYPQPTLLGAGLGLLLFLGTWLIGAVVTSPFHTRGQPDIAAFSFQGVSMVSTVALAIVNGTFEEVFLLGALVKGLRGFGLSIAIGFSLLVRILYHTYQGPLGIVWVATFGLLLSLVYVARQDLWPPVFAHILADIVPTL